MEGLDICDCNYSRPHRETKTSKVPLGNGKKYSFCEVPKDRKEEIFFHEPYSMSLWTGAVEHPLLENDTLEREEEFF